MKIGVAKETEAGELRVALVPDIVARLLKQGIEVTVEAGAGVAAHHSDSDYESAGATIADTEAVWASEMVVKVSAPQSEEIARLQSGQVLLGLLNPLALPERMQALATKGVTACSMELIPRTSRAQSMDALSSQGNIAGYKAVLLGAAALPKFFPMLTTAAGTIRPAKVFVIGAGVAGLQAIATARRLGAVVEAFDIRPAVKEEVQSLGATFVEIELDEETATAGGYAKEVSEDSKRRSQELIADRVSASDVVITTAQVPGKQAPRLVTEEMVAAMRAGSVIVDLAGNQGGNCALTQCDEEVHYQGVTILGPKNLPATLAIHASQLYAKNIQNLLGLMVKDGQLNLDFADDIIDSVCATHGGEVRNDRLRGVIESLNAPVS